MSARGSTIDGIQIARGNIAALGKPAEGIVIQCYDDQIPPFAEAAMLRLYGNLFSSLAHLRVYGRMQNISTYAVFDDGALVTVWLFRREKNHVQVVNEGMLLGDHEVSRFARHILATYPEVDIITFHAVQAMTQRLPLPHQHFNCLEDMVITLPPSADEYLASMGKATRSYIHRYMNKLKRDFPTFRFRVYETKNIDPAHIRAIIDFNRVRMADKGKVAVNDDERIIQLAKECGMVCVMTIDGRVCAGTINYRAGDNFFLEVIGHNPEFNNYRLGTLCCFLTACECIARSGHEYHLLWGQDEYKMHLKATQRNLDDLVLYRSRLRMFGHPETLVRNVAARCLRRARLWSRNLQRRGGFGSGIAAALVRRVRNMFPAHS
ncbi:MAG TPA: GNAT family N-acetyltransferase [Noviherbaspirillum sp.]|uniref:GNAT family N-acetyltransferase n=1 Tax=Noviherbaspirillum sp. TaxID=1926288 RepID=UPI002B4871AB|nr:GNAT family N-acetyltransferase [Noviherbaspirillum sp.]HJV87656.1 GNAT family N-acetyltransferase [Noviherbaspirillum sp.]